MTKNDKECLTTWGILIWLWTMVVSRLLRDEPTLGGPLKNAETGAIVGSAVGSTWTVVAGKQDDEVVLDAGIGLVLGLLIGSLGFLGLTALAKPFKWMFAR